MRILSQTLEGLRIGSLVSHRNLHMYPLLRAECRNAPCLTLDAALASGSVRITEAGSPGRAPSVRVTSECDSPVFLLDGQELIGAMQDRVLNTSILAAPNSSIVIPVSCVEAARWEPESVEFAAAERVHFATGRAQRVAQVTRSLDGDGEASADQVDIWAAIDTRATAMNVTSPTRSHAALFRESQHEIEAFVRAIKAVPGQAGAVFAIGAEIVGCDIFDSQAIFAACLPKLVRSAALDALVSPNSPPPHTGDAAWFIDRVRRARTLRFAAVGLGEDVRLCGDRLAGGALVAGGRIVHLCAFDVDEDRENLSSSYASQ